jgi:hypothetical protein
MFVVTELKPPRSALSFEQQGELSGAIELRRLFPGRDGQRSDAGVCARHSRVEAAAATPARAAISGPAGDNAADVPLGVFETLDDNRVQCVNVVKCCLGSFGSGRARTPPAYL